MSAMVAIENDIELDKAIEDLGALMELESLTPDQELLLLELGAAIEEYEDIYYPITRQPLTNKMGTWNIGQPKGKSDPFFSVVKANGEIVALRVPNQALAEQIALIPLYEHTLDAFLLVYHACFSTSRNPGDHDPECPYRIFLETGVMPERTAENGEK